MTSIIINIIIITIIISIVSIIMIAIIAVNIIAMRMLAFFPGYVDQTRVLPRASKPMLQGFCFGLKPYP